MRELIDKAQAGDRAALDKLLAEHADRLEYFVRLRLGQHLRSRLEVDDVLQEVGLRACRSLDRFRWEGEASFLRWLKAVADHVILEIARSDRQGRAVPLGHDKLADDSACGHALRRQERFERLQEAFDSLSPDHRKVILLAHLQKLPLGAVAERMGQIMSLKNRPAAAAAAVRPLRVTR